MDWPPFLEHRWQRKMLQLLVATAVGPAFAVTLALVLRYVWLTCLGRSRSLPSSPGKPIRTMIVLGSGGHTAEMLTLLDKMDHAAYAPRCYVVAETDRMSAGKALQREAAWQGKDHPTGFSTHVIPRSREVGQSFVTSAATTLYSLLFAFALVLRLRPQLLIVNGPGTCIPVCAAAFLFRLIGVSDTRIVYVESIARTQRFSLSAKILYHSRMADVLFVQWEQLRQRYPRAQYGGRLY